MFHIKLSRNVIHDKGWQSQFTGQLINHRALVKIELHISILASSRMSKLYQTKQVRIVCYDFFKLFDFEVVFSYFANLGNIIFKRTLKNGLLEHK